MRIDEPYAGRDGDDANAQSRLGADVVVTHANAPPGEDASTDGTSDAGPIDGPEQLARELARVRARSAIDPAVAGRSLAPAWIGGEVGLEDDEAEFIDAMADCLAAGLPLEPALECWRAGDLSYAPDDDGDEEDARTAGEITATHPPRPSNRHRLIVR